MLLIKKKLKSQNGASISFALLLFLVCAVLSSAVIVAGTAAAGRLSRLAEADQRYYAVTSAAGLLSRDIGGKTVTVEYSKKTGKVTPAGSPTILSDASEKLVEALSSTDEDAADKGLQRTFELTPDTSIANAKLGCVIKETLQRDGMLLFDVSNASGDSSGGVYTLRVVFSSKMKRSASDSSEDTVKTTVTWKLHSIHKIRNTEDGA